MLDIFVFYYSRVVLFICGNVQLFQR